MVGKKIEHLIKNSNISQSEVAAKLNISRPTLMKIYTRDSVETEILFTLCKIFSVEASYFFTELEGLDYTVESPTNNEEESKWKTKYFEAQKRIDSLQSELSDLKDKFIAFQELAFKKMNGIELGKRKAYSASGFVDREAKNTRFAAKSIDKVVYASFGS